MYSTDCLLPGTQGGKQSVWFITSVYCLQNKGGFKSRLIKNHPGKTISPEDFLKL